jgi:DNA modification methylase
VATAWRNRIVGLGEESPEQLVANPLNWRTHPAAQRDALRGSLGTVGWVQQVMVNKRTGNVVDGHARVEEAISRHEATVPVLYVDLEPDEERLVLASLDPIAAMAQRDDERLRDLLDSLETKEPKVGLTDPDDAPDLGEGSNIQRGDLFALGDHRLMCGDSTDKADVARLLDGGEADLLWTDPPYGVAYQTKLSLEDAVARRRRTDGLEVANDALSRDGTHDLLVDALKPEYLKPGGCFYVAAPSGDMELTFRLALQDAGLPLREAIVWVKDVFVMGRQDYHWRHETVMYGWRDGAAHYFSGGRKQDTVWEIARPKRSEQHPTMKPVELVERAVANSSRTGETVYDPFAGSGTTLIAAERLSRRGRGMEIDPRYLAVALERWENFTGRKAERIDGAAA